MTRTYRDDDLYQMVRDLQARMDRQEAKEQVPIGSVVGWSGEDVTTPPGYLPANGAAISRVNYADLFAKTGIAYGDGDGSTTFNVPQHSGYLHLYGDASGNITLQATTAPVPQLTGIFNSTGGAVIAMFQATTTMNANNALRFWLQIDNVNQHGRFAYHNNAGNTETNTGFNVIPSLTPGPHRVRVMYGNTGALGDTLYNDSGLTTGDANVMQLLMFNIPPNISPMVAAF